MVVIFLGRRQAGEVEINASQEQFLVGFRRGLKPHFFQLSENKMIDPIAGNGIKRGFRRANRSVWRDIGPMFFPLCSLINPFSNQFYFFFAQRRGVLRSEEHTSELQSLMRNSYAVFCLKKKKQKLKQNYIQ